MQIFAIVVAIYHSLVHVDRPIYQTTRKCSDGFMQVVTSL